MTVYNNEGFVEDWPELKTGRYSHGCGHFVNTDNKVVRNIYIGKKAERKYVFEGYCPITMEEGFAENMRI